MKKIVGLLIMVCAVSGAAFAQYAGEHQHEPRDMLIGINVGSSVYLSIKNAATDHREVSVLTSMDVGLTYDFYIFNWLSVNTGLLLHPQFVAIYKPEYVDIADDLKLEDYLQSPLCLTIPLQAHINVPRAEWLYVGAGINFNIPLTSMTGELSKASGVEFEDTKGSFFISLPIDIGFDLIKFRDGGARFFFRFTPAFLKQKTLVPFGFIWQIYNFRIDT